MNRWIDNPRTEKRGEFHMVWLPSGILCVMILVALMLFAGCSDPITVTGVIFKTNLKNCWACADQTYIKTKDGKTYDFNGIHGEVGDTITVTLYEHNRDWIVVEGPAQ